MVKFDIAYKHFGNLSADAVSELAAITALIEEGVAPTHMRSEKLLALLRELRESYEQVRSAACSELGCSIDADDDSPVSKYLTRLESFRAEALQQQVDTAKRLLADFLNVESESAFFMDALRPIQDEARRLYETLEGDSSELADDNGELHIDMSNPQDFMDALELDDFGSGEGVDLLDRIERNMSRTVMLGIASKSYYLPSGMETSEMGQQIVAAAEQQVKEKNGENEGADVAAVREDDKQESLDGGEKANIIAEADNAHSEVDLASHTSDDPIRPVRPVKANAKLGVHQLERKFLKKMTYGDIRVVSLLMRFGACTAGQLLDFVALLPIAHESIGEDVIQESIAKLERADIACTFDVDGVPVHVITQAGQRGLMKETIREHKIRYSRESFWPIPFERHDCRAGVTMRPSEIRRVVAENAALINEYENIRKTKGEGAARAALMGTHRVDGVYVVPYNDGTSSTDDEFKPDSKVAEPSSCKATGAVTDTLTENETFDVENGPSLVEDAEIKPEYKTDTTDMTKSIVPDVPEGIDRTDTSQSDGEVILRDHDNEPTDDTTPFMDASGEMDTVEGFESASTSQTIQSDQFDPTRIELSSCADAGQSKLVEEGYIEQVSESPTAYEKPTTDTVADVHERARRYIESSQCQSDEDMRQLAIDMIKDIDARATEAEVSSALATVITLSRALSGMDDYDQCDSLYEKLQYALDPFSEEVEYTSSGLTEAFGDAAPDEEGIQLSACLNAMAFPRWGRADHDLWSECKERLENYESLFPSYKELKSLFRTLYEMHDASSEGFSRRNMQALDDGRDVEKQLLDLRERARAIEPKGINVTHRYSAEFARKCVGEDSDIGRAMRMVAGITEVDEKYLEKQCKRFCDHRDDGYVVSSDKVLDYIKHIWHDVMAPYDKKNNRIEPLKERHSRPTISACKERLNLIVEWVSLNGGSGDVDARTVSKLRSARRGVLAEIDQFVAPGVLSGRAGGNVVRCALSGLAKYLRGDSSPWIDYTCFLTSGFVTLDEDLVPAVNDALNAVTYAEPWRQVLRHHVSELLTLEQAKTKIDNRESVMYDNLTQLSHIHDLLGTKPRSIDKRMTQARREAESTLEKFENELEMDVLYDLIDDNQKETIDITWRAYKNYFYEMGDFGVWAQFIEALRKQVSDYARAQHETLAHKLDERYELLTEGEDTSLLDVAQRMLDDSNFATVEECLNLFDEGERTFIEDTDDTLGTDTISEFLNDEKHGKLYSRCVQKMLVNEAFSVASRQILKDLRPGEKQDVLKSYGSFLQQWPDTNGIKEYDVKSVGHLLRGLGFEVRSPKLVKSGAACVHYEISQQKSEQGRTDYKHPIAKFGTDAPSKLQILIFTERADNGTIFDEVEKLQNMDMTIVIVDKAMSLNDRRDMAEIFHKKKSGLSSFICIDRVLAVYLAAIEPGDRMPELLRCTLPFTKYQPFSMGSGSINDEMFVGRSDQLRRIVDPMGSTLVYGGRQLGKSVLLEHAERHFSTLNEKYVSALYKLDKRNTDDELVGGVVAALRQKKLKLPQKIDGIDGLCNCLENAIAMKRAERILLLIDEADEYLKAIRPNNYENITPMVNLMRKTQGRFKFVFAGLHDVFRARKAFEDNGTLGQLAVPICIRPLARRDALRLIERPLSYLGYHIDEYPHLMTILTKTNYYPGILQLFGYTLVESISEHYGRYYRAAGGNPPYALDPRQLADVLKKKELKKEIRKKFRMSIEDSKRYEIIALLFALFYRECEENDEDIRERDGFEAQDIWDWIVGSSFSVFENDDKDSFTGLLDEMCEMNILFKNEGTVPMYRLRHYDFLSFIGGNTVGEIFEELGRYA